MTDKQKAFVQEYLVDLNATQAAIRAGYSADTANEQGSQNLAKLSVEIKAAMDERAQRTEITQDRVLKELARIGFADIRKVVQWGEERTVFTPSEDLEEDDAATVSSVKSKTKTFTSKDGEHEVTVEIEMKMHDKLSALEKIGKHLGMFTDKVEHSGNISNLTDEERAVRAAALLERAREERARQSAGE